ncbi:MAG: low temperature requirement protein A [Chloroflexi bacterium]|nr:low temperature requirement protein A [Chloroflexota bacterium]
MSSQQLWQRPQLRRDEDLGHERKASWLELFFDLVFVVAVAELAHTFADHQDAAGALQFVLLFVALWWVWIGVTYYHERFETNDISLRLLTFAQMLCVAIMGYHIHDGTSETSAGFAIGYIGARTLLLAMWLWGGFNNAEARPMTNRFGIGFSISLALWVISLFVPVPARLILWAVALTIELATPFFTLEAQARLPTLSSSHLPERFGVFIILVLREPIAGVIEGAAKVEQPGALTLVDSLLGMMLALSMWWIYFDHAVRQRIKGGSVWFRAFWSYLHLPLVIGMAGVGAALLSAFEGAAAPLETPTRWIFGGSLALALVAIGVIELLLEDEEGEGRTLQRTAFIRFSGAALLLVLAAAGGGFSTTVMFAGCALVMLAQVVYDLATDGLPAEEVGFDPA